MMSRSCEAQPSVLRQTPTGTLHGKNNQDSDSSLGPYRTGGNDECVVREGHQSCAVGEQMGGLKRAAFEEHAGR